MTEKRPIVLLASAAVLAMALQETATSAPSADAPAVAISEPAATAEPATQGPANAVESAVPMPQVTAPVSSEQPVAPPPQPTKPAAAPAEEKAAAPAEPSKPTGGHAAARERMEQRRAELAEERARRYQEMRARAAEHGLEFPQQPPWRMDAPQPPRLSPPPTPPDMAMPEPADTQWGGMTREERNAQREERYQKMRARAMQRRQEAWDRWDSYWKVLDAMTPEQKEAIEAVFGRAPRRSPPRAMGNQMPPAMPMQPYLGPPDAGFPSGSGFPGYGQGPEGAEPPMNEWGPAPSWLGQHPMFPGGMQPWYGGDEGSFQGPPPPGVEEAQP